MEYNFYHYPVYTTPYSTDDRDGSFQPEHRRINDDIDLKMFYLRALLQIEHSLHEKLHHVLVLSFGYQGHLDLSNFKQNNKLKKNLDKKLYKNSKIHRDDWLRMDDYLGPTPSVSLPSSSTAWKNLS